MNFTYADAVDAIRKTSQAMAIVRTVSLAEAAREDGAVRYEDDALKRWQPAIDAAGERVRVVRMLMNERIGAPIGVEWWTPITLIEALGATLWGMNQGGDAGLSSEEMHGCLDAIHESLGGMYEELSTVADQLRAPGAKLGADRGA